MKTPKVIRFRCYCVECSDDDEAKDASPQPARAASSKAPPLDDVRQNETNPLPAAGSIEKTLFGA
ncbi:hypothetical protein HGP17_05955 [Rhizobium sp. P38BS-XIX]|uniref:hypothetical protein n=1 Tax=Rhizobium sp. P38BS-XIX TaxID=2726740 RepID=UPI00145673E5|nr:hypothetical protein [Rhizobium sp. P38BS-XIX]NLR96373.1 hypothetical protein [Rhizobium sp. P38BS-XIX]